MIHVELMYHLDTRVNRMYEEITDYTCMHIKREYTDMIGEKDTKNPFIHFNGKPTHK